ncbi:MAG: hypothetical protein RMX67_05305, partial [Planktomarina sp.]|nr:hypothetical protein [Planktomarina sp.]
SVVFIMGGDMRIEPQAAPTFRPILLTHPLAPFATILINALRSMGLFGQLWRLKEVLIRLLH